MPGRPFAPGADARRGHGKKGRSGRPPAAFKQFARALYDDPIIQAEIRRTLSHRKEKHYASVLRALLPVVTTTEDGEALAKAVRQRLTIEVTPKREPPAEPAP